MAETGLEIAVIGISGRFPGAATIREFWENLQKGVESLPFYSEEELVQAGTDPGLIETPGYIKSAGGVLDCGEDFDALFFDYVPNEALVMDPQVRIFHEIAWEALEDAGYNPHAHPGKIGLYAGVSSVSGWGRLVEISGKVQEVGRYAAASLADSNFLSTRVAYKLDLKGPSFMIQSACSTSLAAIDQASRALWTGQCDMALAGGVSVAPNRKTGYLHKRGMNLSADGHGRAFDMAAAGAPRGQGAGVVVLKLLAEAIADRDTIYAVIKGTAANNDGNRKVGYTAPSIEGQAEVIRAALVMAEIEPETVTYVETNGTCTPLGDPIEIEALTQGLGTRKKGNRGYCRIGTVKANVGHLDAAAGIAAFIKVVLALIHRQIPPSLHFETPNPKIDFATTPFRVNTGLTEWNPGSHPLRAGVNAFGIGGANVHILLEEAPPRHKPTPVTGNRRENRLLVLSAKTATALETLKKNLAHHLEKNPGLPLTDAAYTLQVGRKSHSHRWAALCTGSAEAIARLTTPGAGQAYVIPPGQERSAREKIPPEPDPGSESFTRTANLWLQGHDIDWQRLYLRQEPSRVPLPTYPFERQRYRLPQPVITPAGTGSSLETPVQAAIGHSHPRPLLSTPYEAPATETQYLLVETWKTLFGYEQIGIRDNFLELGGDSLKAITLIAAIHRQSGREIPVPDFFSHPTVETLARYMEKSGSTGYTPLHPVEKREYYLLSPAQKRLYVLQQLTRESTAYNETQVMILTEVPEMRRLARVFGEMIWRHECYRSPIIMKEAQPVLGAALPLAQDFDLETGDLTARSSAAAGEDLAQQVEKLLRGFIRPFDLAKPPFLRALLVKTGLQEHLLVVDKHHIVSDGLSQHIFIREAAALLSGRELPQPRHQYKDYAQWLNRPHRRALLQKQQTYWLKQFQGEVPVLSLPLDKPRPALQSFAGALFKFEIGKKQTGELKDLALKQGTTLYAVLLAAMNILLSKLSGQEDIIVGTPTAGRRHADLQPLIGMFVNTLALRNFPAGEKTLREFLRQVGLNTLEAFENQDYPFEELVEQLPLQREISRNPLFDTVFVMQNFTAPPAEESQTRLTLYPYQRTTAKFDLTFMVVELREKLYYTCEYCTALFFPETIARYTGYFRKILSSLLENPGQEIAGIEILEEEEKNRLLFDFNRTAAQYPGEKTLQQLFALQAARTADNIALAGPVLQELQTPDLPCAQVSGTRGAVQLSYRFLDESSGGWAEGLRKRGVEPDTLVGISLDRSLEMITGILAILKAGGAYMPIDPEYPEARLNYMLKDSGVKILVTAGKSVKESEKLRQWEGEIYYIEELLSSSYPLTFSPSHPLTLSPSHPLTLSPSSPTVSSAVKNLTLGTGHRSPATSLAYVIYTSGTTGKPKGTLISHRNVIRLFFNDRFQFDFSETDTWTLFHSFCFDFSVWEMYGPLLYGGKSVIVPKMVARDTEKFLKRLKREQVTILNQTPSAFYNLAALELAHPHQELNLRYIIFGGEALAAARLKEWQAVYPGTRLINMYGITETTVHVTYKEIGPPEIAAGTGNIGRPIPTLTVYLVDRYRQLVPVGAAGEICVGGAGVARGYLNRPELTAEKFCLRQPGGVLFEKTTPPGPPGKNLSYKKLLWGVQGGSFLEKRPPGRRRQKTYHSGDLARWLPDGNLEYLGRSDQQVKIRGFRIEPGEIESRILNHQDIEQAVILGKANQKGEKCLCAYFVATKTIPVAAMREFLSAKLPDYMIPAYFVQLEKIPLTIHGKLDRKALPEPGLEITAKDYEAPGDASEEKLVEIWQEVLGIKKIGTSHNFFEIGGDSIKAIRISARLQRYGLKMEIRDLFVNPTVKQLSKYIKKIDRAIPQGPVAGEVYLTPIQRWFFDKFPVGSHHYNQAVMLYQREGFEEVIVAKVFARLVQHHDALRMIYKINRESAGKITVRQRNRGAAETTAGEFFTLDLFEIKKTRDQDLEKEITAAANRVQAGIDLERGPLVKLALFKTVQGDHLLIVIHHLVIDGVSWRILLEDFAVGYRQVQQGQDLRFQEKTDSFQSWAQQLREYAQGKEIFKESAYWQGLAKEITAPLPRDTDISAAPAQNTFKNRQTVSMKLDPRETETLLKEVNHAYGTEINDILLAALGMAVKEWSGIDKILVNLEGHGRESIIEGIDISRTLGWYTSQFPVLLAVNRSEDLSYTLKAIKEMMRHIPNKGIGYGILKYLTPAENKGGISFVREPEISFNYLGQFGQEENTGSDTLQQSTFSRGTAINPELQAPYAIDINGIIAGKGELLLGFTYNIHEYKRSTLERLASLYRVKLLEILSHCTQKQEKEITPSDLTYSGFSLEELENLNSKIKVLVDPES